MMTFSLWKHLRRRLRRYRRPLWTLGGIALWLLVSLAVAVLWMTDEVHASTNQPSISDFLMEKHESVPVMLYHIYVCGEETEPYGLMSTNGIVQLLQEHPEWSVRLDQDGETVMLIQSIDDLSDYCKTHAYFGIDKNGNFSLFDGAPKQEKVIRTFFQLDIEYLESSLPQHELDRLLRGIRVSDMDGYNSVLSTFSDYAMEQDEAVQKQAY